MLTCWDGGTVDLPKRAGWGRRANSANTSRNLLWPFWLSGGRSPILSPHPTGAGKAAAICRGRYSRELTSQQVRPSASPSVLLALGWVPKIPKPSLFDTSSYQNSFVTVIKGTKLPKVLTWLQITPAAKRKGWLSGWMKVYSKPVPRRPAARPPAFWWDFLCSLPGDCLFAIVLKVTNL